MDFELMIHRQAEIDLEEILIFYNNIISKTTQALKYMRKFMTIFKR